MKKILTFSFMLLCCCAFAQTLQNINKNSGTISNPINQIDSIRFNTTTNQMEVVLQSGLETHALTDVVNVTFTSTSNGCGSITSVTDMDGNVYPVVEIGNQCWIKENLKTSKFADGSAILNITDNTAWGQLTTSAWCNYENSAANDSIYGKLYNWFTVADPRNVCPLGWHVPLYNEWIVLTDYLGGEAIAGGKMKSTGTQYWSSPNEAATNESGFSFLPGGTRNYDGGGFFNVGYTGYLWSSTEAGISSDASCRVLYNSNGNITTLSFRKRDGLSVRCLKD